MALLFCDNFENWQSATETYPGPWLEANSTIRINTGSGAGGYATGSSPGTNFHLGVGCSNTATIIVNTRQATIPAATNGFSSFMRFLDGATVQASIAHKQNGRFAVYRGNFATELGESVNSFSLNSEEEYDLEVKITIHNTTGSVELRINGVVEISLTNVNTRAGTNNYLNLVRIGTSPTNSFVGYKFKHFILMDTTDSTMNDFIGPVAVTSLRPNEDGHYDDWTPNTGDRFAAVNQAITDEDTTYVTADTATDKVSFKLGNLPAGVTDVFGVFAQAQIKREAETTRIARMFLRSGLDDEPIGSAQGIGPTYAFRNAAVTVSPFTTNAFDVAEINDIELGMEITT